MSESGSGRAHFTLLHAGSAAWIPTFLATLKKWRADPLRCARLDFVAVHAQPPLAAEILGAVLRQPAGETLEAQARELAARYPLPLAGLHRLEFGADHPGSHVLADAPPRCVLTLAVGDVGALLAQLCLAADAIHLDDVAPVLFKAVARLARPNASITVSGASPQATRKALSEAGFQIEPDPADTVAQAPLHGMYRPPWPRPASWPDNSRPRAHAQAPDGQARHVIVIGAGLAGACAAWSLSRRGWRVSLLDAASGPAGGTSGLPAGLMVPHVSPDDAPMSRLTRAGAALMREWIDAIALAPRHWRAGVLQSVDDRHKARAPAAWNGLALFEWRDIPGSGSKGRAARFFPQGLSIEPPALIRALLAASHGLEARWHSPVSSLVYEADPAGTGGGTRGHWVALDTHGTRLAQAPTVVVAAALDSLRIVGRAPDPSPASRVLRPVRGQITLGTQALTAQGQATLPAYALSGDGHFIPALRADSPWPWLVGASFERGETALQASAMAEAGNLEKLARLAPDFAALAIAQTPHDTWVGVRCTSPDRLPLVGACPACGDAPGLHLLAALGSRGLSVAAICAELLACQLNDEPWPVEISLARALDPARFFPAAAL